MIEEARLEDLEEVYNLICILEDDEINKDHFINVYKKAINNQNVKYLVYRKDHQIVGFLSFYIHKFLHHNNDTGEIVELIVKPEYRSLHIGDALICTIEEFAKECSLEQIELSTSTYRKRAHAFYEKHGYLKDHYNYTKNIK